MILFMYLTLLPIFVVLSIMPFLTRKIESFGVTIPENSYNELEIKKMRHSYLRVMIIFSAIVSAIYFIVMFYGNRNEDFISAVFTIIIFMYMIISFLTYLHYHKAMKILKNERGWETTAKNKRVIDTNFRKGKFTFSLTWYLIPFAIIIFTIISTYLNYERIPSEIPLHYGFNGEVTDTTVKSLKSVIFVPLMQMYLLLIFIFVHVIIHKSRQEASAVNPQQSTERNQQFRRRWSIFNYWSGTGLILIFTLLQLNLIYSLPKNIVMILPILYSIAIVVAVFILSVKTGQSGSRIDVGGVKGSDVIERDEDRYWKLGIFYFNPNDPVIFVEKRFGVGWTNNFARPMSWLLLIGIIAIPIIILNIII